MPREHIYVVFNEGDKIITLDSLKTCTSTLDSIGINKKWLQELTKDALMSTPEYIEYTQLCRIHVSKTFIIFLVMIENGKSHCFQWQCMCLYITINALKFYYITKSCFWYIHYVQHTKTNTGSWTQCRPSWVFLLIFKNYEQNQVI